MAPKIWAKRQTRLNSPHIICTLAVALVLAGCATPPPQNRPESAASPTPSTPPEAFATVTEVEVTAGEPGTYTLAVTLQSPDTGCDRYANWWEVLDREGNLIYRRILAHSHVEEQPFRRTGGTVALQPDDVAIVRGHMYPDGYGTQAMQGTVEAGFEAVSLPPGFAANLADAEPQPRRCDF